MPRPATLLLARGTFTLSAPIETGGGDVQIRGVGVGGTVLVPPTGMSALRLTDPASPTTLTVIGLSIRPEGSAATATTSAIRAAGMRATLRVRDVAIDRADGGVVVNNGATLCGDRLSVVDGRGPGVMVLGGSHGYLRGVAVRGGGSTGVIASRAHLVIVDSLVSGNQHDGIALLGAASGAACNSAADCPSEAACVGFLDGVTHERACRPGLGPSRSPTCVSVDRVQNVVLIGNTITGLRAQRSSPSDTEAMIDRGSAIFALPGPPVRASWLVIADTRIPAGGGAGGDGIYLGPGAAMNLDVSATMSVAEIGRRSELIQNARAGLLIDGDDNEGATAPNLYRAVACGEIMGALIASNRGPGVFVQQRATVSRIAFVRVVDNTSLGVAVTTGAAVALLQNDQFIATRLGALRFEEIASPVSLGDGLSIASTGQAGVFLQNDQFIDGVSSEAMGAFTQRTAFLQNDQFADNMRIGVVMAGGGSRIELQAGNSSTGDRFGYAALGGVAVAGDTRALGAAAPASTSYASGHQGSAAAGLSNE